MKIYDMTCQFDTQKSFYGKAKIKETQRKEVIHKELLSYDTLVASCTEYKDKKVFEYLGKFSQTTTRHQKEFFKQLGLSNKEIEELFKNGKMEVKE